MTEIFKRYLSADTKVILFGSRATGTAHRTSDYDFALQAESKIPLYKLVEIKKAFQGSTIPYKIDIVDIYAVSQTLFSEIREKGKEWKL